MEVIAEALISEAAAKLKTVSERFGLEGEEQNEARELLAEALGRELLPGEAVTAAVRRRFQRLIGRRMTGEPLEFITGRVRFAGRELKIRPGMFIPRVTSEFLASQAVRRLRGRRLPAYVDVATGIGPVALTVALGVPHARVWGLDISQKAVNQAAANARRLGAENASFRRSDLFARLPDELWGQVDVVTIHPPYVPNAMVADLPAEIRKFEPRHTLTDGSPDGFGLVRRVIDEGRGWIRPGGWLLIEIMPSESRRIRSLLKAGGYGDVRSTHGEYRETRVVTGRT
ncbi:MAG: N5-glutamine methyltransferase family protein [Thermoleophilia bacterium]